MLKPDDRDRLLGLARRALEARVRGGRPPEWEGGGALDEPLGVFVSLHARGKLRGCLGRLTADLPLAEAVVHLAAVVSDSDPRFAPVTSGELGDLLVEISVLLPEREVRSVEEIIVGRHGLMVEHDDRCGLLLPQVASERGWDRDTFVAQACEKAGLRRDAWQRGARVFVFEAEVFGETVRR